MPGQSFQPPSDNPNMSEFELQARAEQLFPPPKKLQELPLILVSPSLLHEAKDPWPFSPAIQSMTHDWLQRAHIDDKQLRIKRSLIPHTPICIPDTLEGQQFFKLAKLIGDIPLNAPLPLLPDGQNQEYWLKTLHYYWQARGVVITQQVLGVIADPLGEDGALKNRLPAKILENLRLSSAIDAACIRLLVAGENFIKQWARENERDYPFKTVYDLFLELLEEEFLVIWQLGPLNSEKHPLSKAKQRDNIAVRARLLKCFPWLVKKTGNRQNYDITEQEYLQYLQEAEWSGYWILALRPQSKTIQIEPDWELYIQAFTKGKELAVDTLDWLRGEPFNRSMNNAHESVEGTLDALGYIHWSGS